MKVWDAWKYDEWFAPPIIAGPHPAVTEAERYLIDQHIERHPFFAYAASSREALTTWVSQEIVVTGFFSQALLRVAALISNVHLRTMMMKVIEGEHGRLDDNTARWSHPWLLHKLRQSLNVDVAQIRVLEETREFVDIMHGECGTPLRGVAALGMGNERLLLPEYAALRGAFEQCWPDCGYKGFLDANLNADAEHARLLGVIASALIERGGDPEVYLRAARRSVDSRIRYHDRLLSRFQV